MASNTGQTASSPIGVLLHTALYDSGGESVEGGFVDRWVSNASVAIAELERLFTERGFAESDAAVLRTMLRQAEAPVEATVSLLVWLKPWTLPLVKAMLDDPLLRVRALAVQAAGDLLDPGDWLPLLHDADPGVRAAAVRTLAQHKGPIRDAPPRLRCALEDGAASVRRVAAGAITFYRDPDGAQRWRVETDREVREAIILSIAEETNRLGIHIEARRLLEGIGPSILAILLQELHHPHDQVRHAVARALQRFGTPEVALAMLERLQVEDSPNVLYLLLLYSGYPVIAEQALPVLDSLRRANPDAALRRATPAFVRCACHPPAAARVGGSLAQRPLGGDDQSGHRG
jgi:hypothetical protein